MKFYIPYILIVDRLRNSLSFLLAPHNKPIKPTLSTLRYATLRSRGSWATSGGDHDKVGFNRRPAGI